MRRQSDKNDFKKENNFWTFFTEKRLLKNICTNLLDKIQVNWGTWYQHNRLQNLFWNFRRQKQAQSSILFSEKLIKIFLLAMKMQEIDES